MNGNFGFVFQGLNRLWMVTVTLIHNGSPQKMVQRGQITAPRRPNDQNFGWLFSFPKRCAKDRLLRWLCGKWPPTCWNQMSSMSSSSIFGNKNSLSLSRQRSPLTVTLARCSFSKKNGPVMPPYHNPHQTVTRCSCIGFSMMFGFSDPQIRQFCLLTLLTFCPNNRKFTE